VAGVARPSFDLTYKPLDKVRLPRGASASAKYVGIDVSRTILNGTTIDRHRTRSDVVCQDRGQACGPRDFNIKNGRQI